ARSRRPPHRDLLLRLPDRRSRPGTDQVGPEGPPAADAVGRAGAALVVREWQHVRRHARGRRAAERAADRGALKEGMMTGMHPRFLSFSRQGRHGYGLAVDGGVVDLSARHGTRWPTLREVIADGALARLADEGAGRAADFGADDFRFEIPVPSPEKI